MNVNNKILITVIAPLIEEKYDIYIPVSKNIKVTKELLAKAIIQLSDGCFPVKDRYLLMNSQGVVLPDGEIVKNCKLSNGDRIVLI